MTLWCWAAHRSLWLIVPYETGAFPGWMIQIKLRSRLQYIAEGLQKDMHWRKMSLTWCNSYLKTTMEFFGTPWNHWLTGMSCGSFEKPTMCIMFGSLRRHDTAVFKAPKNDNSSVMLSCHLSIKSDKLRVVFRKHGPAWSSMVQRPRAHNARSKGWAALAAAAAVS